MLRVKELCAAMGGQRGFASSQVVACVDKSPLACKYLVHSLTVPVIQGDICEVETIRQLHLAGNPQPAVITAGFPCQPFSAQGDGKVFEDNRAQVLWGVFRAAWLTNEPSR